MSMELVVIDHGAGKIQAGVSASEILSCLDKSVEEKTFFFQQFPPTSGKTFQGSIKGSQFTIWKKHIYFHNSFQPILFGTIENESKGCTIKFRLGIHWFVRLWITVWFTGLFFVMLGLFVSSRFRMEAMFGPVALVAFGVLLVNLDKLFGGYDKRALLKMLQRAANGLPTSEADLK